MSQGINDILQRFSEGATFKALKDKLANKRIDQISGLVGSSFSINAAALFKTTSFSQVLIALDKEHAAYVQNDLQYLLPEQQVLFYPASHRRPYEMEEVDNANVLLRSEVIQALQQASKRVLVVTYADALLEKTISRQQYEKQHLTIKVREAISLDFLNETLFEYEFERVDFVNEPGDFSVRGGILDVYSFSNELPYRMEFFGDQIESIRTFDPNTQLSVASVEAIDLVANIDRRSSEETSERVPFLAHFDTQNTVLITYEKQVIGESIQRLFEKGVKQFKSLKSPLKHAQPQDLFCNCEDFAAQCQTFFGFDHSANVTADLIFNQKNQPAFNKRFDLLWEDLKQKAEQGYQSLILCASAHQVERFHEIHSAHHEKVPYYTTILPLHEGFIDQELKICCYTDHQIFERYHKFNLRGSSSKKQGLSLKELNNLELGDYVTHIDHGIGKFAGLQKIEVEGKWQEAIKLIYGDRDMLYVSIHSLHKIAKFNGKDGAPVKLYKLGSGAWKKVKHKTKEHVKKVAFDLIEVYAKRKLRKGFAYTPDSYLQHELEASFIYEDTPDQEKATLDVKADMESDRPMDRLICGDVGFGKTEVAIRAAFKAVDNGKQVAVLVPTTILAFQHANTFKKRLENLPVTVDFLNRFRSSTEKKEILTKLKEGQIDILIGTHQIVNSSVSFKDLGLLIVDEEQKFGVSVKEKIKSMKAEVDVLTLTATPIPRTLQFSLMAARDLSVISTPPPNRYPIESRVVRFDQEIIRDAIREEIERSGQVYFIHNRIENIKEMAGMLQRLVPDARIRTGHGQMDGNSLEELMLDFMNGSFDVLVSTTIVESGLDIPNANTILIHNAHTFGLSDLHQMRGRVGRTNKKAFCYFITDSFETLTPEARKRMEALARYTELGSGFQIAMKDLEIRGAGDLLGGAQSGFINEIGFDTYQKIVAEAIEELKQNEFKSLYQEEGSEETEPTYVSDVTIDTDLELLFPDHYINSVTERLTLYRELSELQEEREISAFRTRLIDRFGPLPEEAEGLMQSVMLKEIAKKLGIEKIVYKRETLIGYFLSDGQSPFFQGSIFQQILAKSSALNCQVKEKKTKSGPILLIRFDAIASLEQAGSALSQLVF
jgi:transcription-repair coupling factor (superfamily II helicase)